jgi:2-amino-4-hydroxy-6-hydroxymethyldihydropteridine diphosphokinase
MIYYLSLGSNQGDRIANLTRAIDFLQGIGDVVKVSPVYETEPVGMEFGTENFYNMVLSIQIPSSITPVALLQEIKIFEKSMGRVFHPDQYLPRTIDIDILLAGSRVIKTEGLVIPHREMSYRAFVLIPLKEIAPDLLHPVLREPIKKILKRLPVNHKKYKVKKIPPGINF